MLRCPHLIGLELFLIQFLIFFLYPVFGLRDRIIFVNMSKASIGDGEADRHNDPSAADGQTARALESDATTVADSAPPAVPAAGVPPGPELDAKVEARYPGPLKFWLIVFCLCTILFLVVLVSNISNVDA